MGYKSNLIMFSIVINVLFASNASFSVENFQDAKTLFKQGKYDQASVIFKKVLEKDSKNVNCRYYYAQTLVYLDNLNEAQLQYQKIINISPYSQAAKLSYKGLSNIQGYYVAQNNFNSLKGDKQNVKNKLRAELLKGLEDNYIDNVADNGLITRWDTKKLPLSVYFYPTDGVKGYQIYQKQAVIDAFDTWSTKLPDIFKYNVTNDLKKAQVVVLFKSGLEQSITTKEKTGFVIGLATPHISKQVLKFSDIKFTTVKPDSQSVSNVEIYNTALHEIGHMLGIYGHSSNSNDIMYPVSDGKVNHRRLLSNRDINTVKLLYKLDADISNFSITELNSKKSSDKNSLVLGNVDERLNKELNEALDYVKRAPGHAISWTSLGTAYYNMKKYQEATENYNKALSIDSNFTQARNGLANVYNETGNVVNAIIEYQKLIQQKPSAIEFSNNLAYLYVKQNRYAEALNVLDSLVKNNPKAKEDLSIHNLYREINKKLGK